MAGFVIYHDEQQLMTSQGKTYLAEPMYFVRLGLGLFWECTPNATEARRFDKRSAASHMLTKTGKHRQGWRVVPA